MAFKFVNIWRAYLTGILAPTDTLLPVTAASEEALCAALGSTDYTYLSLRDGVNVELVKATCVGGAIEIERAQGGTQAHAFAKGSCAAFEITDEGLRAMICETNCDCDKVKLAAGETWGEVAEGIAWQHTMYFTGTQPLTLTQITTPPGVTFDTSKLTQGLLTVKGPISGSFTGIPIISFAVAGCSGSTVVVEETLNVCAAPGAAA